MTDRLTDRPHYVAIAHIYALSVVMQAKKTTVGHGYVQSNNFERLTKVREMHQNAADNNVINTIIRKSCCSCCNKLFDNYNACWL